MPDENHRTIFFGDPVKRTCRICLINTPPISMCMNYWREFIREKIWNLNEKTIVGWDFLGNQFINNYAQLHTDEIKIIDRNLAMPELKLISESITYARSYIEYYFLQNCHLADVKADLLLLHNSWTPPMFKKITPEQFFYIDCTMVNVLAEALEINLPPGKRFSIKPDN